MVYVSLMCVELDRAWTFVESHGGSAKRLTSTSENRVSKTTPSSINSVMIDSSSTTYHLGHSARVDLLPSSNSATGDFESSQPYIADCSSPSDGGASPPPPPPQSHERPGLGRLWPLRTTTLLRVPGDAGFTSIAMLHLHQLHSTSSHRSSLALSDEDTLRDACRNYHELSVLARTRWMRANPILPFHLAALEIMDRALRGSLSSEA
jgi:mediator of RNA polymerase II transcription subunit 13, fungi type